MLTADFPAADTDDDDDPEVDDAEALAFLRGRLELLPATHQTALSARRAAETTLADERAKALERRATRGR